MTLVLTSSTFSLHDYYSSRYLHDDYQTLVRTIQACARSNEAILLDTDEEWPIFEYHYSGSLPRHHIPAGEDITPEKAHRRLDHVWAQHDGLWVVFTSDTLVRDPGHAIENWLQQCGQVIFDQHFDSRRLVLYAKSPRPLTVVGGDGFAIQHPLAMEVDEGISISERIVKWKREEKEIGKDKYLCYEAVKSVLPDIEKQKAITFIDNLLTFLRENNLLFNGWQLQREIRRKIRVEIRLLSLSEFRKHKAKIDELEEKIFRALEE